MVSAGSGRTECLDGTRRGAGRREPKPAPRSGAPRRARATSQNRWPSLVRHRRDQRPGSLFPRPASTTRPSCGRRVFGTGSTSRFIRNGRRPRRRPMSPTPITMRAPSAFDVLVVGASPAGLAAALPPGAAGVGDAGRRAAESAASLLSEPAVVIDGKPAWDWPRRHRWPELASLFRTSR